MIYFDILLTLIAIVSGVIIFFRAMRRSWLDAGMMSFVYFGMMALAPMNFVVLDIGVAFMAFAAPAGRWVGPWVLEDRTFPEFLEALKGA